MTPPFAVEVEKAVSWSPTSIHVSGKKEELAVAGVPEVASKSAAVQVDRLMPPAEATRYRGIAARLNAVAQDKVDLQYACKEASRSMARPQLIDWAIGR